jgi:ferredoxin
MKVIVDYDSCESNGKCMEAAPEIFKLYDDGTLEVLNETPPADLRAKVEKAVRLCPKQAIKLEE